MISCHWCGQWIATASAERAFFTPALLPVDELMLHSCLVDTLIGGTYLVF
jgi:hypothetical protein